MISIQDTVWVVRQWLHAGKAEYLVVIQFRRLEVAAVPIWMVLESWKMMQCCWSSIYTGIQTFQEPDGHVSDLNNRRALIVPATGVKASRLKRPRERVCQPSSLLEVLTLDSSKSKIIAGE